MNSSIPLGTVHSSGEKKNKIKSNLLCLVCDPIFNDCKKYMHNLRWIFYHFTPYNKIICGKKKASLVNPSEHRSDL